MKNLLIRKSFSYEIVDFTLLWQSNTYHLGGVCSIQLSYEDSNDMKFMKRAFLPPRTLMTGILGGGRSIQLSYSDSYKIYIQFYLLPFSFSSQASVLTLSQEARALSNRATRTCMKILNYMQRLDSVHLLFRRYVLCQPQ